MPNLLLIDDDIKLRGLLKRIPELESYRVSEAGGLGYFQRIY
jgi:two-component system NtrC family response regulator